MAKQAPPNEDGQESEDRSHPSFSRPLRFFLYLCSSAFICGSLFLAGCATGGKPVDQAMQAERGGAAARSARVAARYFVGCPDVLEVRIAGTLDPGAHVIVGPDGRIDLNRLGTLRVEGQTVAEVAQGVAELAGVPAEAVRVRVAEYNSQRVYLFGEVAGLQRAVAYQGEETVADLLQRAGGITAGAAPAKVHVIRPRVTDGKAPLIYHVDLEAVILNKDASTNLRVQPFDQIYVGETRRASMHKCVPPLFRPLYEAVCGLEKRKSDKVTR
jgi:protein involved in polysaccharide export with SLBB domain